MNLKYFALACCCCAAGLYAHPTNGTVSHGSASVSVSGAEMSVKADDRTIINWESFSVDRDEALRFNLPSVGSAVLNRVVGDQMTSLLGRLSSNGGVFLINPQGIVVGEGALINCAQFTASTLDLSNSAFLDRGPFELTGKSEAPIVHCGTIDCLGDVVLVAARVDNSGLIRSRSGAVALAANSTVILQEEGERQIFVNWLDTPKFEGEVIANKGVIEAASVELHASGGNPYALAINHSGVIRAVGLAEEGGQLLLKGPGKVFLNSDTLHLNAPIEHPATVTGTAAEVHVSLLGSIQTAINAAAPGATVTIAPGTYVQEAQIVGKDLTLQGSGETNTIISSPLLPTPLTNFFTSFGNPYHPILMAENATTINIQDLTVDGNLQGGGGVNYMFVGIGYHNAGGTVSNAFVTNVADSAPPGGDQSGHSIFASVDDGNPYHLNVGNCHVTNFQKSGINLRGPTLTFTVNNNVVEGAVPPGNAAPNGIEVLRSATGTITNNTVSNVQTTTVGTDSSGILLFGAGSGIVISGNSVTNSGVCIADVGGGNVIIKNNTCSNASDVGIFTQDVVGQVTIQNNTVQNSANQNIFLSSSTNQPFLLENNTLIGSQTGLLVQGSGSAGPEVTMVGGQFIGTTGFYIQMDACPNNIWPSTASVTFDGLISGEITRAQFEFLLTKIFDKHNDPALGLVLDFIPPIAAEGGFAQFPLVTRYFPRVGWRCNGYCISDCRCQRQCCFRNRLFQPIDLLFSNQDEALQNDY